MSKVKRFAVCLLGADTLVLVPSPFAAHTPQQSVEAVTRNHSQVLLAANNTKLTP